jgi:hypothetical protein
MQKIMMLAGALVLLASVGSLAAQEADTTAPAADYPAVDAPAVEPPVAEGADEAAPLAETPAEHDWEFVLAATDKAPGASATVMVVDAEEGSDFVLEASGLPLIDSLDEENRDMNAYTVWIVPGKEKVGESRLAGILTVSPDGTGRLEAKTDLKTFGVIVTATPDGAPEQIGGVPVLTGIPVQADAPPEAVEEAADTAEDVAEEVEDAADEPTPAEAAEEAADVQEEVSEGMEEVEEAEEAAEEPAEEPVEEPSQEEPDTTP